MRKTKTETKTTQTRVAEHRDRLKASGMKRLDLFIKPEAFEALKNWTESKGFTYSEGAEHLFLAAAAPLNSYSPSTMQNETPGPSHHTPQNAMASTLEPKDPLCLTQSISVVESFFQSRIKQS